MVGGGQAGLAMSHRLAAREIDHVVLEKHKIGHDWRDRRWDSFCLVTPNWQCMLPGFPYSGEHPHGFMPREEIARYVEAYAASFEAPVVEGVEVTGLRRDQDGPFELETDEGELTADQVVVATGGYHEPQIPRLSERLPDRLHQVHSSNYRNPDQLPAGDVLVVGTGQSGCQIAEDLHLAGRRVHLCVGSAPRTARFYRGRDVTDWLDEMGYYEMPVGDHSLGDGVRLQANHYVTGRDGGHDIDLRRFALEGMRLYGRLTSVDGRRLGFSPDLRKNLDHADDVYRGINSAIDDSIAERGIDAPAEAPYRPPWEPEHEPEGLDLGEAGVGTVIWSTGYASDYDWIEVPVFDGRGYPTHERGVTNIEGLYFVGLPWLHTWGSGRFSGVARDAEHLAEHIDAAESASGSRRRGVPSYG